MTNTVLVNLVKDLSYHFAEYHYNEYIRDKNLKEIPKDDVTSVVRELFNGEKQKQLKQFIRKSLKDHFKEQYQPLAVEGILSEMFDDIDIMYERIALEIRQFQKSPDFSK